MIRKFVIEVDCANCAAKMEEAVAKLEGVKKVAVNFMMQKMTVEFADGADVQAVVGNIVKTCKKVDRHFTLEG